MPIYDCGRPECIPCREQFGPDRGKSIITLGSNGLRAYRRNHNCIYDAISGKPIYFFHNSQDAQMCITLMEAVAR